MLTSDQASELAEMFRLLGEPNRLGIVANCLDGPLSVGEITARLALSQSLVSHHLRLLRAARLLKAGRRGKQVFYGIPDCHVREMLTNMIEHLTEAREQDDDLPEVGVGREQMSVTVDQVKCTCSDCACVVNVSKGVQRDGHVYCSDACADHHKSGAGCQHAGYECHG